MSDVILVLLVLVGLPAIALTLGIKAYRETSKRNRRVNLPPPSRECARVWRVAEPN